MHSENHCNIYILYITPWGLSIFEAYLSSSFWGGGGGGGGRGEDKAQAK